MKNTVFILSIFLASLSYSQTASFTQVGPVKFPDNPSVQTTGMGRVSQLVYHPKDSMIMFAVSASGGVFKSSNEGATWKPISDLLPQTSCATLAINPLNPKVMYLGTGDANYNGGGLGVWKTTNGGNTWFQSTLGLGNKLISYILITPNDTATLIAACSDGIYKSTSAGGSWSKKTTVNASYRDLLYRPASNKILYAATNTFFYRSYDNGNTWTQSTLNSGITCAGIKIAVCPKDTSKLYCVVWKSGATSPFGGIYKSTNNGTTFTMQADTPNILGYSATGKSTDGQGAYNLAIACDPNNSNTLYIAAINVWKSTNQGAVFTLKSHWAYGVHADKHGILFSPYNANKLFIYHDGGLDRSTDGGTTWTTLEDGLSASEFYKMGNSGLHNDYIIGGLQDNGMDVATNKKFSTVRGGDWGGDFAFDAFDSKLLYENGGIKRNIITHATGNIRGKNGIYTVHPNDSNVMFEATSNIFRTKNLRAIPDSNVAWSQISNFTGNTNPIGIAYSKSSNGTFYSAFTPQGLYKTINGNNNSPTFSKITNFPFKSGEEIKQLEACDYDSNCLYVVTNQSRIYKTKDKGGSWTILNKNLPANTIIKFLLDQKSNDSSMYVCTAFGIYYRNKTMANWIAFSQGMPTVAQISDMEIMSDGTDKSRLHISTYGRGIWQSDLYKSVAVTPIADFIIQPTSSQLCANSIILVNNSTHSPTSIKWQVWPSKGWNYINGTDSLSSRAEIQFNTAGSYFISLIAKNEKGSHVKTVNYNYSNTTLAASCATTTNILGGFDIGIYRFEFNTIDKASGAGNMSYEEFSCKSNTIVKAGATYTAWVTNGSTNNENAKIYIDYNNNGSFADANELVGTIRSGKGRRSCAITLLSNPPVLNKFIRMRAVSDFYAVNDPCGALGYGQSEDYSIWIDKGKPMVNIIIPKPLVSNRFTAVLKLSEGVTGFDENDIKVTNAALSSFKQSDALTYSVLVTPKNNGSVLLDINANGFSDLVGNLNLAASDSTKFFLGIKSFTFSGLSVKDSIIQTSNGGNIFCYVPFGTNLDSLIASFTLSDTSFAFLGNALQVSSKSKVKYNTLVYFNIISKDSSLAKTYAINVIVNKNTECTLIDYAFVNPSVSGTIAQNSSGGNVSIMVPFGTDITTLVAVFTLSDSAKGFINSVKQISNTTINNFSSQLIYTIRSQDSQFVKTYFVNVSFGKSKSCELLTYAIKTPSATGVIITSGNNGTVNVKVPFGTDLSKLTALFTASTNAKVSVGTIAQLSGVTINNFTNSLVFKVVADDTNFYKVYTITVILEPNSAAMLLAYQILNPSEVGTISPTAFGGYVDINVPFGTDISNLVAQFSVSDSASAFVGGIKQISASTANKYQDTLVFNVRAHDKITTKKYLIALKISAAAKPILIKDQVTFYPNPVTAELVIVLSEQNTASVPFEIVDVLGKKLMVGKLEKTLTKLSVSALPNGVYYLKIKMDSGILIENFVKE